MMGSEIREVVLQPDRIRPGDEVTATIRYRVRDAEPVVKLEVSAGYRVSPEEVAVPRTRTETRFTFVVERDRQGGWDRATGNRGPDLCVVTFRLGRGAVMDADLWVSG